MIPLRKTSTVNRPVTGSPGEKVCVQRPAGPEEGG